METPSKKTELGDKFAFPDAGQRGMTLWEWYAGQALAGAMAADSSLEDAVKWAWEAAYLMMRQRQDELEKTHEPPK
jgi:hypothetical protein